MSIYFASANSNRIDALAGVRAIAISLVLFRHGIEAIVAKFDIDETSALVTFISNGWSGVDLFFVLSGFLIGYHLLLKWPENKADFKPFLKSYAKKRSLRILPVYCAGIALAILIPDWIYSHPSTDITYDLVVHGLFLQDYHNANFIVSLWSLATEVKFYIIAPFLLLLIRDKSSRYFLVGLVTVIAVILYSQISTLLQTDWTLTYGHFFWIFRAPFHYAVGGLLIGLCIALIFVRGEAPSWVKNSGNTISFTSIILLMIGLSIQPYMVEGSQWIVGLCFIPIVTLLFSGLLIGAIYSSGLLNAIYCSKLSHFLSAISYPLYVVHMLVIPLSLEMASSIFEFLSYYLLSSIALGLLLHHLIEKPFLKVKDSMKPAIAKVANQLEGKTS